MKTALKALVVIGVIILIVSGSYSAVFFAGLEKRNRPNLPINVACIGDSITEWSGYPADLQIMLGDNYNVGNFGVGEAAVSPNWYKPYTKQSRFEESKEFGPSIVVIMLGTNDAHTYQSASDFASDYENLVSEYQALEDGLQIILVKPPPIFDNNLELSSAKLDENVIPAIEQVAEEMSLPIVDVNSALANHPEYFEDGVHPNSEGAMTIAMEIGEAIIEDFAYP